MPQNPGIDAEAAFVASIRHQLHQARRDRGWTLLELAQQAAGVSPHLLERYEQGKADVGVFEFQQMCAALELDVNDVLDRAQRAAASTREK